MKVEVEGANCSPLSHKILDYYEFNVDGKRNRGTK
jgi:hypothetical protein